MKQIFNSIFLLTTITLLTSCTTLDNLKKTTPSGTEFQQSLAKYYQDFATLEAKDYDWQDSDHFAKKAMLSARGTNVLPEELKNWRLPSTDLKELQDARANLMQALNKNARNTHPKIAAHTQFSFDCWVEERGENWQFDKISQCKADFYDNMSVLNGGYRHMGHTGPTHILLFDFNRSGLTQQATRIVDRIAKDMRKHKSYHIILSGYADSKGSAKYNYTLSKKRADNVKKRLITKGVKGRNISEHAYGSIQSHHDAVDRKGDRKVVIKY